MRRGRNRRRRGKWRRRARGIGGGLHVQYERTVRRGPTFSDGMNGFRSRTSSTSAQMLPHVRD